MCFLVLFGDYFFFGVFFRCFFLFFLEIFGFFVFCGFFFPVFFGVFLKMLLFSDVFWLLPFFWGEGVFGSSVFFGCLVFRAL